MKQVDLSKFSNTWYKPGNIVLRILWYITETLFFSTPLPFPTFLKKTLLQLYGAKVGIRVRIKPNVKIKYPWFLEIGNNVWIGEGVWIDNLTKVKIGNNVCISQGAYIMTGNHNYKKDTFDLMVQPVIIEDGVWIGAKVVVCPGVKLKNHSVIAVGSVVTKDTEPYTVYQGNPAKEVRKRNIE